MEFRILDVNGVILFRLGSVPTDGVRQFTAAATGLAVSYSVGSTLYYLTTPFYLERGQVYNFDFENFSISNYIKFDTNLTKKSCIQSKEVKYNFKSKHFNFNSGKVFKVLQFNYKEPLNYLYNKKCFNLQIFNKLSEKRCFKTNNNWNAIYKKGCVTVIPFDFVLNKKCLKTENDFYTNYFKNCFGIKAFENIQFKTCVKTENEFYTNSKKVCFNLPIYTQLLIKRCANIDNDLEIQSSNFSVEVLKTLDEVYDLEFSCLYNENEESYDLSFENRLCKLPKFKYNPKVEFIMNKFKISDVETDEELNCLSCELSYSQDSLTWDCRLEFTFDTNPLFYSVGRKLKIELNGFTWNVRISNFAVNKVFAKTLISASAESIGYFERTQEIVLPTEGHPSAVGDLNLDLYGSAVDGWQISTSGNRSLQAVNKAIADSIGGVLMTEPETGRQYVKPLHGQSVGSYRPISDNFVISHNRDFESYNPANVAILTNAKKAVVVKIGDTAQNVSISSNLPDCATNEQAIRLYAERVLKDTDVHSKNRYSLPLSNETGLLLPTDAVVLVNRYVVVNSLSISVKWQSGLVVRQDIEASEYQIKGHDHNG